MNQLEANIVFDEPLFQIKGKVLVIIGSPWQNLAKEEVELLSKILSAVGQSIDGVTIQETPLDLNQVINTCEPACVLCFEPSIVAIQELYRINKIDETPLLCADLLTDLNEDKKRALWGALKQLFGT